MSQEHELAVKLTADIERFQRNLNYAKRSLSDYSDSVEQGQKSNTGFNASLENMLKNASELRTEFVSMTAGMTVGLAGLATATVLTIDKFADQGKELEKQATMADVSVERIQSLAYASEQYGVSGDKMADILKDVNDKFGDFAQTGGGEFADFFDNILPKVGLTTDELQKMSGPEALVAVKEAMDAANIPMKDQIYYLESLGNDASALLPLLENQGQKLYELEERYKGLGVAMSEIDIANFKQMDQQLDDVGLKVERAWANAVLGSKEQIDWFSEQLVSTLNWWGALWDNWDGDPKTTNGMQSRLNGLNEEITKINKQLAYAETQKQQFVDNKKGLDWRNWNEGQDLDKTIEQLDAKRQALQDQADKLQELINKPVASAQPEVDGKGNNSSKNTGVGTTLPSAKPVYDDAKLFSYDLQLADESEKLRLAHENRLADIESYNISAAEIKARGYESLAQLREAYGQKEDEYYQSQLDAIQAREDAKNQKFIDAFQTESNSIIEANEQRRLLAEAGENALQEQENMAYDARVATLQEKYAAAYLAAGENQELKAQLNKEYMDAEQALFESHQSKLTDIEKQQANARLNAQRQQLSAYSSLLGSMSDIAGAAAGEQSGLYKTMFIASKAFAIAESIIKIQQGIASAASLPFPANIPAMATVAASTAGIVSTIQSTAMTGMAHDGIDSVPSEGTWLLNTGERVYTNDSVAKLDQMYSAVMGIYSNIYSSSAITSDQSYSSSGVTSSGSANVIVNLIEDASRAGTVEQSSDGDITTLDIRVAKLLNSATSQTSQVMKSRYRNQQYGT
jgi:hypothetical protein